MGTEQKYGPAATAELERMKSAGPAKTREETERRIIQLSNALLSDAEREFPHLRADAISMMTILKGRGGKVLRSSPPDEKTHGDEKYVWRMLRLHLGIDVHMPVCAEFYVRDTDAYFPTWGLEQAAREYRAVERYDWSDPERSAALKKLYEMRRQKRAYLDKIVDWILWTHFPLSQYKGAMVWGRAMGF